MLREVLVYISTYIGLFVISYYIISIIMHKRIYDSYKMPKVLPKVTVIIPAYNEEEGIISTIKSVLEVDYPKDKMEVMVVDDGSKDSTYKKALSVKDSRLSVYTKSNGGKATALNFGIKKAKGSLIVTMDADSTVAKDALIKMIPFFSNQRIMCVSPSILVDKPRGILQRVQQIEYLLGVFLRRAFASVNALHITPGAFSAYRKDFFEKYGGFEVGNLTEDMEMALRIQYNGYRIESSDYSLAYTTAPNKFLPLLKQRRRWYFGLARNFMKYSEIFSRKFGEMGLIVLPTAVLTIFFSIFLTSYILINSLLDLKRTFNLLQGINFNFMSWFKLADFTLSTYLTSIFSNPIMIFAIIFVALLIFYMVFAKKRLQKEEHVKFSVIVFLAFYSFLFSFWWLISIFYALFYRKISWGK
jgi:cellulose synthase/poly-beta-1,6-N-acetylglucosamine synthase-like glycosyltransferase